MRMVLKDGKRKVFTMSYMVLYVGLPGRKIV